MLIFVPKIIFKDPNLYNTMSETQVPFLPSPGRIARGLRPIFGSLPTFWLKAFLISDVCSYTMGTIISLFRAKEHDTNSQLEEIDSKLKAQFESRLQVQRSRKKTADFGRVTLLHLENRLSDWKRRFIQRLENMGKFYWSKKLRKKTKKILKIFLKN